MVVWPLALFSLGLPAHAVVEIVVRAYYALHDTKTPVAIGIAAMGLNVGLSVLFIRLFASLGWLPHGGLALSNTLATTLEMGALMAILARRLGGLEGAEVSRSLARVGLAAAIMGLAIAALAGLLASFSAWLLSALAILAGAVLYLGLTLALGSAEPRAVWGMISTRRRA
jgi:putative peptidoglycan lipid II flippase